MRHNFRFPQVCTDPQLILSRHITCIDTIKRTRNTWKYRQHLLQNVHIPTQVISIGSSWSCISTRVCVFFMSQSVLRTSSSSFINCINWWWIKDVIESHGRRSGTKSRGDQWLAGGTKFFWSLDCCRWVLANSVTVKVVLNSVCFVPART